MKNKIFFALMFLAAGLLFASFVTIEQQAKPWKVPDKYKKMTNPVKADKESLSVGKSIYNKHCKSCHGKEGLGDGAKADQLDTPCGDFTTDEFKKQSDGVLFYKSYIGRDEMPSFEKKIPDEEDAWHVINYMKTL
jgi:mono/diheme cytochrome c family protein